MARAAVWLAVACLGCRGATAPEGTASIALLHSESNIAFGHIRVFARYVVENRGDTPFGIRLCDTVIERLTLDEGFKGAWGQSCTADGDFYIPVAPFESRTDSIEIMFKRQPGPDGQLVSPWTAGPISGVYRLRIGIADEARRELPLAQRVSRSFNLMEPEP